MPECVECKKDGAWTCMVYRNGKPYHPECWVKKQEKAVVEKPLFSEKSRLQKTGSVLK